MTGLAARKRDIADIRSMTVGRNLHQSREERLSDFLLDGALDEASVEEVVDAGLAAYAIHRAAEADEGEGSENQVAADDPRLQRGRLLASVRHTAVRRVIVKLVAAWREAGIDTLLHKGFMLAEFVYPSPAWRTYSDVDVALRGPATLADGELAARAADVARGLGWEVIWRHGEAHDVHSHHDAAYDGHELLLLHHPGTAVNVDAHRRLVHSNVAARGGSAKARVITEKVWAAASRRQLDGTEAWIPVASDAALVGLIAGRSWSGDRYALRPHDLLDLQALMSTAGFGLAQLMERAEELGMARTTKLFLRRCDPETGVLTLRAPSGLEAFYYDTLLMPERGHRGLQRFAHDLAGFPALALQVARVGLSAMRLERGAVLKGSAGEAAAVSTADRLDSERSVAALAAAARASLRPLDRRTWRRSQTAVRRALQLAGTSPERDRAWALELLAVSLLQQGYDVSLVTAAGRAWLEHRGRPLPLNVIGPGDEGARAGEAGWDITGSRQKPQISVLSRLASIGWRGLLLRAEALLRLVDIRRRLRKSTFKQVRSSVLPPLKARNASLDRARSIAVGRAVESAARFVPGALCLAQSLAGQVMLSRRGVPSTIHVGFLRSAETGEVSGHAWLEAAGEVVTGDVGLDAFTRTTAFEVADPHGAGPARDR